MKNVFIYRGIKVLEQITSAQRSSKLPPLVILASHYHRYETYKDYILSLSKFCPVIFLEFPSFGENTGQAMNDVECADILARYFQDRNLRGANLMAIGDSTGIAYFFSYMYPRWPGKLILSGVAARLRDSVRTLFKANIESLANQDSGKFITGMHSGLMNHSKRNFIESYQLSKTHLYQFLQNESLKNDPEKSIENLSRYIKRDDLPDDIKVPTLLIAGEYDPFTSVHDHFLVAKRCQRAQLAVISQADHLCLIQRPKEFLLTTLSFIVKDKVADMAGVKVHNGDEIPGYLRQIYPRIHFDEIGFIQSQSGSQIPINIKDINIYGCQLFTLFSKHRSFRDHHLTLRLNTEDVEDFKLDLSFFSQNRGTFKAVFHHPSLDVLESFEALLERFQQSKTKKHSLISA